MNVSLTRELEAMVQAKVRSGSYGSASEVVREALRLFQEREQLHQVRLEELRKEIAVGVAQAERGPARRLDVAALKARARRSGGKG
ncbi:MAG: type II toxin-antitoxin system ParD family antitoxin [Planctomycetota bacterium]|nr:type II toxin-antitoxin system ParD family antitoxin [Planctomycetota bacterium]